MWLLFTQGLAQPTFMLVCCITYFLDRFIELKLRFRDVT
jgi:hypothetical protein